MTIYLVCAHIFNWLCWRATRSSF